MADAAAPQNSISTGTSMRMSVKVKYARRRVLKDATQGSQKQQQAMKRTMREKAREGESRKKKEKKQEGERKNENNVSLLLCFPAQSHWHSEQPYFNHRL